MKQDIGRMHDQWLDRQINEYCGRHDEETAKHEEKYYCTRCGHQNTEEKIIFDFNTKKEYCLKCNHDLSIDFLAD
jgi:late competence protein required for DNA uptake (superfamily II DNA/RNA helicase)